MYKELYHTLTEQVGITVVGLDSYKKAREHFEKRGFKLVATSKPYELSNIVTMTFEKKLEPVK